MASGGKMSWQEGILSWILEVKWEISKSKKGDTGVCRENVRSMEHMVYSGRGEVYSTGQGGVRLGSMELEGY